MRFSNEKLWKLEGLIDSFEYKQVKLGGLIAIDLQLGLQSGQFSKKKLSLFTLIKPLLMLVNPIFSNNGSIKEAFFNEINNKPILTFISHRIELLKISSGFFKHSDFNFVPLILDSRIQLNIENAYGKPNMVYARMIEPPGFWDRFFGLYFVYVKLTNLWSLCKKEFHLSRKEIVFLKESLLVQIWALEKYTRFLKKGNPTFVITEYDRYGLASPLVLAAKNLGIPSFSLMHGVINNPYGYVPILADKLFVWGKLQKDFLLNYSHESNKILIGGGVQFSENRKINKQIVAQKLGLEAASGFVAFGSSNVPEPHRSKALHEFCRASLVNKNPGLKFLVKLHPAEKPQYYEEIWHNFPDVVVLPKSDFTNEEFFSLCDVLVIYCSALGFDAILNDKPLIILNVSDLALGNSRQFIDEAGVPECFSHSELLPAVQKACLEGSTPESQEFKRNYCSFQGEKAVRNIQDQITKLIDEEPV